MPLPQTVRVKLSSEAAEAISLTPVVVQDLPTIELIEHILGITGKDEPRIRDVLLRGADVLFTDASAALERAFARTAALEADSRRVARHALKALLAFALLDRRRLPVDEMPAYMERVGIYRDFNALFFRRSPAELAELLIGELERAGAVKREAGWLVPC